ncbi:MAG: HAD family phosphatase [Bacteroidetes bacterium]|nr:HAD family phosphatase [Bacteroidota bacterium]
MIKMIISDLDGTLLTSEQKIGDKDYQSLLDLGERNIIRVIATGRSPFSFSKVIPRDFPIDYLVFSSGAGVMDWKTGEILIDRSLSAGEVEELARIFYSEEISFKVLAPVPDNHHYVFFQNGNPHPDFMRRMEYYRGYEKKICFSPPNFGEASQFLIILPDDVKEFDRLSRLCLGVKVVRATSPIDHQSIWMEVFHPEVSKGTGCRFLCDKLEINQDETLGIGNDYNDLDLLDFTAKSFIVENAPQSLKDMYKIVTSNNNNGFTDAITSEGIIFP